VEGKLQPINTFFPEEIVVPVSVRRGENPLYDAFYRFERMMGMRLDYIEEDPKKSARNILQNKNNGEINELYEAVSSSDVIVVDGDGDLIFKDGPGRINHFNLSIIELADALGKEVHYVNSIFSDPPLGERNEEFFGRAVDTLSRCSTVALRDPFSVRLAEADAPELEVEYVPDSLFHWYEGLRDAADNLPDNGDYIIPYTREEPSLFDQIRFDEPYICIAGGSRAANIARGGREEWSQEKAVAGYIDLVERVKDLGPRVYLTPTCSGDEFMYDVSREADVPIIPAEVPIKMGGAILSGAEVFITGRYHPSILASLGGTPCVFLGADSHKTRSIQEVLRYETKMQFSALPDEQEVEKICELAERYLSRGDSLRSDIRSTAKECAESARRIVDLIE
jgi:polysaccharide pyruvyl transferase WcaK-like protein